MSHHSFSLPDEILAVIPTDPYDQLDVARRLTYMAITSRVSALESEARQLHQTIADKDRVITELEDRLRIALDENLKLSNERDSLAAASKKLGNGLAKLETFKRHLMRSLSEDNVSQAETVDIGTYNQSEIGSLSRTILDKPDGSKDLGESIHDGSGSSGYKFSISPCITPRLNPIVSPKASSTAGTTPRIITSGTASPVKYHFEQNSGLSSLSPSSHSSSTSTPNRRNLLRGQTRIDGKEFFRQARSRLSYEQFRAFLTNIKQLNAQRQSREETLVKAQEIFGSENKDLYLSFRGLFNHNLH